MSIEVIIEWHCRLCPRWSYLLDVILSQHLAGFDAPMCMKHGGEMGNQMTIASIYRLR